MRPHWTSFFLFLITGSNSDRFTCLPACLQAGTSHLVTSNFCILKFNPVVKYRDKSCHILFSVHAGFRIISLPKDVLSVRQILHIKGDNMGCF